MKTITKAVSVVSLALGMFACAPTQSIATKVDTSIDCRGICSRYATCYDTSYDVGTCETHCNNTASKDGDFRRRADACNECISGTACAQASAQCANECTPVVPMNKNPTSSR
jgi:hypothetical protein